MLTTCKSICINGIKTCKRIHYTCTYIYIYMHMSVAIDMSNNYYSWNCFHRVILTLPHCSDIQFLAYHLNIYVFMYLYIYMYIYIYTITYIYTHGIYILTFFLASTLDILSRIDSNILSDRTTVLHCLLHSGSFSGMCSGPSTALGVLKPLLKSRDPHLAGGEQWH